MEEFPDSQLLQRRNIVLANISSEENVKQLADASKDPVENIWRFSSPQGYELNVSSNSLSIVSNVHKSYKNPEASHRFRDAIELSVSKFFDVAKVPIIERIGLRYIDHCPIFEKNTKSFKEYYKTTLPTGRFKIEDAQELHLRATVKRGDYNLSFGEKFLKDDEKYMLVLDYDAFAQKIKPEEYLTSTDELYNIISNEYLKSIKESLKEYMRTSTPNQ